MSNLAKKAGKELISVWAIHRWLPKMIRKSFFYADLPKVDGILKPEQKLVKQIKADLDNSKLTDHSTADQVFIEKMWNLLQSEEQQVLLCHKIGYSLVLMKVSESVY